jgi:CheY-like chemotaxis protein
VSRILVVEPHRDIRELLSIVIVRLGHEPVFQDDGDERFADVDAAVVDPDGAGRVAARRLRARRVPSVFTSIFPPEPDILALEPVAYLLKPFPLYALEHAVAAAVDSARDLAAR